VLTCLLAGGPGPSPGAEPPDDSAPLEWRVLLIIKAEGQIEAEGFPHVRYRMTGENIEAVRAAFIRHTPEFVEELSAGRLRWRPDVVVSQTPLTTISRLGDGSWVGPECVAEDLAAKAPAGQYDGVFIYWKSTDDETAADVRGGFGWSIGPTEAAHGAGYSTVNFVPDRDWGRDSEWTEVFLHEWLHQLEAYYGGRGVPLPRGGLHGNDHYGFQHRGGWKHWYRAFLTAELVEPDGRRVGLGEPAWRLGRIRDEQALRLPEFLTPERLRANLLKNESFELDADHWSARSWRGARQLASIDRGGGRDGGAAARLRSAEADDGCLVQTVAVRPNTRYLLAGWGRTEDVEVLEPGGASGATLSVVGGYEASRSLRGTTGWTYLTLVFDSGERTEVAVGGRLGHHGSTARGAAWFDDLVLLELPQPSPAVR
jgi:hypothetical protein